MKTAELTGAALDWANELRPNRITHIDTKDYRLSRATAYISRKGQSIAVTLFAAKDPRYDNGPDAMPPRRVYLKLGDIQHAKRLDHLVNLAMHKSTLWLDHVASNLWHAKVVLACRPLRSKCKPLLSAIQKTALKHYGNKYWFTEGGRALLTNELRLLGVAVPRYGAINHFSVDVPEKSTEATA